MYVGLHCCSNLLGLVRGERPYALLHELRTSQHEQTDLDEALHGTVWFGHVLATRLLLAAGADMRSLNQYGEPLLTEAVYSGRAEMVKLLVDEGYEVSMQTLNT